MFLDIANADTVQLSILELHLKLVAQLPVPLGRLPPFVLKCLCNAQLEVFDNGVCIGDLSLDGGKCFGLE